MSATTGRAIEILLVEDNPGDVRLVQEALNHNKLANPLTVAEDGEEAMAALRGEGRFAGKARPDLVLLDLNLPRKDGREVLAEMKADPELKKIPVVVLTSSQSEADVLTSYELHANCYVQKPVALQDFVTVIRQIRSFWLQIVKLPAE
ncbi:MAG: response regulator [Gemmatimonadota bacterium]|jgi:CheY-like chemotaxis protein